MSFHANGGRRYGHVPPAQYGAPTGQPSNASSQGLHRQSSFDNGDDAAFFDPGNNGHQPAPPSSARASMPSEELYIPNSSMSPQSPGRSSFGTPGSPALSGYQHQYQPLNGPQSPSLPQQPAYNPQNFARSQSHSQASQYRPQPSYSPSISSQHQYSNSASSNHQPYNPAAYQPSQYPTRASSTASAYNNYNNSYAQTPTSATASYWSYNSSSSSPPARASAIYESYMDSPPLRSPSYAAPLPPRQASYNPPPSTLPYPNGEYFAEEDYDYRGTTQMPTYPNFPGGVLRENSTDSIPQEIPPIPPPKRSSTNSSNAPPLPNAPMQQGTGDEDDWGLGIQGKTDEELTQEQIFADIGDALGTSHRNGDLLDGELHRYDSRATTVHSGAGVDRFPSTASTLHTEGTSYDDYEDDESDLEAAAGLEAMRIAEEQESHGLGQPSSYEGQPSHQTQLPQAESSDSDYKGMDLGLAGGGYDAHMSYGDDFAGMSTEHSSEMEDQSRPLPTPHQLSRSDSRAQRGGLGGMADYSMPGEGELHPFPAFEEARVDNYGTGGLERPTSHAHRLSFDEGDENAIQSRILDSRQSVPPMSENRTPQLQPAGSYRNSHGYSHSYSSSVDSVRPLPPSGPEAYPQNALQPALQYVPRSSSLHSHSNTAQTIPPVRSKTDAEERQARAKGNRQSMLRSAAGLDGYDASTPASLGSLDLPALPAGRRKKFSPGRLSTAEFRRCTEPWALSGIAGWIREMAGGETGEGESDLRVKTIEDGLIALFTHMVPTMNTADAETLSEKVVKSMFDAGILVKDEEWVKFGQGEVSGVLWQLTGSGCYSPKKVRGLDNFLQTDKGNPRGVTKKEIELQNNLHEIVMSEDIYMDQINVLRVLYRDNLASWQPPIIAKTKITKFVASVFGKVEAIKDVNENHLLAQLKYRQKEQGPWVTGFSDIFREWIRKAKSAYIEYAAGFPYATYLVRREADRNILFRQFLDQARDNKLSGRLDWNTYLKAPITRLQRYGLLLGTVLKNMTKDSDEKATLAIAIEEIKAVTLECDAKVEEQSRKVDMIELQSKLYLRPGMERVELNLDHLGRELLHRGDLQRAGNNRFTWLETHAILFDHYFVLAKSVIQRDANGLRKKEVYDVSKLPIPMQLLVLESSDDDPVQKSAVKGIGAVTTTVAKPAPATAAEARLMRTATNATSGLERMQTLEHTTSNNSVSTTASVTRLNSNNMNDVDAKVMYPFRIKHLGKAEVYTLYAPSAANRDKWCDKIIEAKTRYAAALFAQNAEPFRLKVVADSAFAYDNSTIYQQRALISISGTPLDRAVRDMEHSYGSKPRPSPVCRAQVNCAVSFMSYGKLLIAIGTDYGVYISEASNPRGWSRTIQMPKVTQIAILEDFSLCIIIADKSLVAYHLDVIIPASNFPGTNTDSSRRAPQKLSGARDVSFFATARMKERTLVFYKKKESLHSVFKVLEPVVQKSSEKKSRLFGKRFGGNTEFFREFDEFYIPTECFTINLFQSYIAISTQKGFELLTLDKKVPMSIPDTKNQNIASIAARLQGQRPLGMFRLSDAEFLLCYAECGVYVDKHGEVSRSVIMEFVGRAKTAAMYGAYLVLFDSDFVEVRNAENGRLRQVIAGSDVRCLDAGTNPQGAGANSMATMNSMSGTGGAMNRTLKLAMAHPEIVGNQIVLEMVLNEGHME
ncbi:CNH domain-containing protein [Botrytis cinerea]